MSKIDSIKQQIIEKKPIVHYIPNVVTAGDCANVLLAIGASATMAHHISDVEEITSGCQGLVCNLGGTEYLDAMMVAGKRAAQLNHPVVLDPVGVAGSTFRRHRCLELMKEIHFSCIRGNGSEIKALMEDATIAAGIDAAEQDTITEDNREVLVKKISKFAKMQHTIIVASGKTDIVTDGEKTILVDAGDPEMSRITGTGCMLSALLDAFLCIENSVESAAAAVEFMGNCGSIAARKAKEKKGGTMTFRQLLIDEISRNS